MAELKNGASPAFFAKSAICHFWTAYWIFFIYSEKASRICVKDLFLQSSLCGNMARLWMAIGSFSFDDSNSFRRIRPKPGLFWHQRTTHLGNAFTDRSHLAVRVQGR